MLRLPRHNEETHPVSTAFPRRLRILVIDDNEELASMLKAGLEAFKQEVFVAPSGAEGLMVFGRASVDIVICDLGMPGMNGWEVCKRLRALCRERELRKPPFIILTGWGDAMDESRLCSESGVDEVVQKPVAIPKLFKAIRELTSHCR